MKVGFIGLGNMGNPIAAKDPQSPIQLNSPRPPPRNGAAPRSCWRNRGGATPKNVAAQSDVGAYFAAGAQRGRVRLFSVKIGIFAGLNSGCAYPCQI